MYKREKRRKKEDVVYQGCSADKWFSPEPLGRCPTTALVISYGRGS